MILYEVGDAWREMKSPTKKDLNSVVMTSPNEGWAVGDSGTLLHYTQGSWRLVPLKTTNALNQIAGYRALGHVWTLWSALNLNRN